MKCYPVLSSVLLQKSFSCAEHCGNFGKEDCIQGPPPKLILNRQPISHTPQLQIEWARSLFLPWSIGNNFIYCHFYLNYRFHAQMNANVESSDFPSHAPHVFPFLGHAKSARIAELKKVGFTFRIIYQQRDKVLVSNFNMMLLKYSFPNQLNLLKSAHNYLRNFGLKSDNGKKKFVRIAIFFSQVADLPPFIAHHSFYRFRQTGVHLMPEQHKLQFPLSYSDKLSPNSQHLAKTKVLIWLTDPVDLDREEPKQIQRKL